MQCDAKRLGRAAATNESLCLSRRGVVTGMAALVVAGAGRGAHEVSQHDRTLFFLQRSFFEFAADLQAAEGRAREELFNRMVQLATAMTVIPGGPDGRAAKVAVGCWSVVESGHNLQLPFALARDLKGSTV